MEVNTRKWLPTASNAAYNKWYDFVISSIVIPFFNKKHDRHSYFFYNLKELVEYSQIEIEFSPK